MDVTDQRRSSHVAALSPDQCAAYAPVPGKLDLPATRHAIGHGGRGHRAQPGTGARASETLKP